LPRLRSSNTRHAPRQPPSPGGFFFARCPAPATPFAPPLSGVHIVTKKQQLSRQAPRKHQTFNDIFSNWKI
jgi:hypothetical protein